MIQFICGKIIKVPRWASFALLGIFLTPFQLHASDNPISQLPENSPVAATALESSNSTAQSTEQLWRMSPTLGIPFRGFEIQTGAKASGTQDPLSSISYSPGPSLEGAISVSYKDFGFTYQHTLASASLDSAAGLPASSNEKFRFSLLLANQLVEASRQRLVGLQTDIDVDGSGTKKHIARPDMNYSDTRFRWIYGLPVWGAEIPNSLANFYTSAEMPKGRDVSVDLLVGAELSQQKVAGAYSFVPPERQAVFGPNSSLSEVSSTGAGLGAGFGLTKLMSGRSYFSIAGLVGGNYNFSKAHYSDHDDDISDFGAYLNARMSVEFVFGKSDSQNLGFRLFVNSWSIPARDSRVAFSDAEMNFHYGINF